MDSWTTCYEFPSFSIHGRTSFLLILWSDLFPYEFNVVKHSSLSLFSLCCLSLFRKTRSYRLVAVSLRCGLRSILCQKATVKKLIARVQATAPLHLVFFVLNETHAKTYSSSQEGERYTGEDELPDITAEQVQNSRALLSVTSQLGNSKRSRTRTRFAYSGNQEANSKRWKAD